MLLLNLDFIFANKHSPSNQPLTNGVLQRPVHGPLAAGSGVSLMIACMPCQRSSILLRFIHQGFSNFFLEVFKEEYRTRPPYSRYSNKKGE